MRAGVFLSAGILIATPATAQKLRRAVAAADLVVVAEVRGSVSTQAHRIHDLRVLEVLRGPANLPGIERVGVLESKRVAAHNKPVQGTVMLVSLHAFDAAASNTELPRDRGPYFTMSGHPGSAVVLDEAVEDDPRLAFTRVLISSQNGQSSRQTAEQLYEIALEGDSRVRLEAAESLSERPALGELLTTVHLSNLLGRATAETEDIQYKIALATICAERKVEAVIPTLCLSVQHVGDEGFLRALGRFARFIHEEEAAQALLPQIQRATGTTKERLIVALGATSTEGALEALLQMHRSGANKIAVEAALRAHGSPRATAAIIKKNRE